MKLKNRIVLVTGASRGIGHAIALVCAKEGATIVAHYHKSDDMAETLKKEIEQSSGIVELIKGDLSEQDTISNIVTHIEKQYGKLDVLVNNAGSIIRPGDWKTDLETWNKTIAVNMTAVWQLTKELVPLLSKSEHASIVNIASYVGQLSSEYVLAYGVAKAGVINMTKAFAKALAPQIRVNCISPGNIDTDMTRAAGDQFIQKTIETTPLKRLGVPEEVAKVVLFLSSDDSSFVTGTNIDVDGGYVLTH